MISDTWRVTCLYVVAKENQNLHVNQNRAQSNQLLKFYLVAACHNLVQPWCRDGESRTLFSAKCAVVSLASKSK